MIARGGQDADLAPREPGHRDVERAAAQVVDEDRAIAGGIRTHESVGVGGSRGLVQRAQGAHARTPQGLERGLALRRLKVRGHRHHRGVDLDAVGGRDIRDEVAQEHGAQRGGVELAAAQVLHVTGIAHIRLVKGGHVGIAHELGLLGRLAADGRAVLGDGDHGGRRVLARGVGQDLGLAVRAHARDGAERRPQIDTYRDTHIVSLNSSVFLVS